MTQILRYGRPALPQEPHVDGYPNFHYLTVSTDGTQAQLESGINGLKQVTCIDGSQRRPAIAVRSSPWKAGHETTPWHDAFDLDHGHVRYFGDHKVSSVGPLGSTRGNAWLMEAWSLHWGVTPDERVQAPPILLFRAASVGGAVKGYVEFCGVAVLERLEQVVQRDPTTGRSFANYVFDMAVLDVSGEAECVDWRWIDDRRDPELTVRSTLRFAPRSWKRWVEEGDPILPRVRRRVAAALVRSSTDQRPHPGTAEDRVLQRL
jgi:hypothetical protein